MATISSDIASYNSSHAYYALSNASNGYADSTNTNYASVNLTRNSGAETYMYWEFSLAAIPTGATINSITCNYKARTSSASTSYIAQATIQMCSGTTTKGTAKSILTTSTDASSFSSTDIGTWTVAEINAGVKLKTYAKRGTSRTTSNYYIYFYGADISITYTEASGNKVYIKASGTWKEANDVLVKYNGSWISIGDVYVKSSDSWVQQSNPDPTMLFDSNKVYISGYTFPTGYTKLQYLESSNTQYINTNYVVKEVDTIEVDYELRSLTQTGDKFILGCTDGTNGIWVETYANNNTWYYRFGSSSSSNRNYGSFASGTLAIKKQHFSVGNTDNSVSYAAMPNRSLIIFGRLNASDTFKGCWVRISEARIKNGTTMVHRYVPAQRDSDSELGMLDLVDGVFYTNAGSGTFRYA